MCVYDHSCCIFIIIIIRNQEDEDNPMETNTSEEKPTVETEQDSVSPPVSNTQYYSVLGTVRVY